MKRSIAIIIVAVLLCVSLATVFVACNDDKEPSITGKYYFANPDGTLDTLNYIELNDDGTWAFSDGTQGTYEAIDNNIVFLVNNIDEYDGVYSDGVLVMSKRGVRHGVFAKQGATIDPDLLTGGMLTVTFDTKGGNALDPVSVAYGDVINGLKTPVKSGFIFDGWYKDDACTQAWNVLSDIVTKSMTLYAKWSDNGAIIGIDNVINDGDNFYVVVDENTDRILLENAVQIKGDATWKLFYDVYGTQEITTKIATGPSGYLQSGANEFYIITYVGDPENPITHTYFLTVYKQYLVDVVFAVSDLPGNQVLPAYTIQMLSGEPIAPENIPSEDIFPGITITDWRLEPNRPVEGDEDYEDFEPTLWDFDDMVEGDLTLYAEYTPNEFTAHLDANGGQVQATAPVTFLNEYTLPVPTLEGHTFVGWYFNNEQFTDAEGKNVEARLAIGEQYGPYVNGWPLPFDEKLEAYWTINNADTYTTRVLVNNVYAGTVSGEGNYNYGEEVTLTAYTNPGYTWVGWYDRDSKVSSDEEYTFLATGEREIYTAKWSKIDVSNSVNASSVNGGTVGYDNSVSYKVGDKVTLVAQHASNSYAFAGWYDEYDMSVLSYDLEYEVELTENDYHYYARWIPCSATFTNSNSSAGTITVLGGAVLGKTTSAVAVPNHGYTFLGWYSGDTPVTSSLVCEVNVINSISATTYEARWSNSLPLSVERNNTSAGSISVVGKGEIGSTATLLAKNNDGYLFTGWYVGADKVSTELAYTFAVDATNQSNTYTANWISNPIDIRNADYSAGSILTFGDYVLGKNVTVTAMPNPGYTFIGWYKNDETTPVSTTFELTFVATDVATIYEARWMTTTVNVISNNSYAGITAPIDASLYNSNQTLSAISNPGYVWEGWFNYVDGSDNDIKITSDFEKEITIGQYYTTYIAKWVDAPEIDVNMVGAGSVELLNSEVIGKQATLKATTNMGYKFIGWFDTNDLENALSTNESYTFELTKDACEVEYIAVWRHVELTLQAGEGGSLLGSFTATFDFNAGDDREPVEQLISVGGSIIYPAIPNNPGHFFKGWYEDQACTTLYDFSKEITSDITLYAGWQPYYEHDTMRFNEWFTVTAYEKNGTMEEYYAFYAYEDCTVTFEAQDYLNKSVYILDSNYGILAENSGYYNVSTVSTKVLAGRVYFVRVCGNSVEGQVQIRLTMNVNVECGICPEANKVNTVTQEVEMGTYAAIQVAIEEGYRFVGWYLNGMTISLSNEFNYFMLEEDTTLVARFERIEE